MHWQTVCRRTCWLAFMGLLCNTSNKVLVCLVAASVAYENVDCGHGR